MTNHPNRRGRGNKGYVPTPDEIRLARGVLTQSDASALIYGNERVWRAYEAGSSRMHPASWELFLIKSKKIKETP